MSGPTNHQLKRALDEVAQELNAMEAGPEWADACTLLASSPVFLTMLANKLAQPALGGRLCVECGRPVA